MKAIKNVILKISLEVSDPINDSYEDIEQFVNKTLSSELYSDVQCGCISNYKMLVEVDESSGIPY